jgi:hypothetical protein
MSQQERVTGPHPEATLFDAFSHFDSHGQCFSDRWPFRSELPRVAHEPIPELTLPHGGLAFPAGGEVVVSIFGFSVLIHGPLSKDPRSEKP